jgi:hypothetical protein
VHGKASTKRGNNNKRNAGKADQRGLTAQSGKTKEATSTEEGKKAFALLAPM